MTVPERCAAVDVGEELASCRAGVMRICEQLRELALDLERALDRLRSTGSHESKGQNAERV